MTRHPGRHGFERGTHRSASPQGSPSPENDVGIRRRDNPQPLLRFGRRLPTPPSGTGTTELER
eukprot:3025175-Rhodomonas_salina.1